MNDNPRARIWEIRPLLDALYAVREEAISYIREYPDLDPGARSMWISDMKSMYNSVYAAWELLNSAAVSQDSAGGDAVPRFLSEAKARLEVCASEIRSLEGTGARQLSYRLRDNFAPCWKAIEAEYDALMPPNVGFAPAAAVVAAGVAHYQINCAVCGKTAGEFEVGQPRWEKQEMLLYKGITSSHAFDLALAPELFQYLSKSDLRSLHRQLKKFKSTEDGLDVYCPDCDKAYCRTHYQVREEWDQGFYDCSYGRCPKGHERMIDD